METTNQTAEISLMSQNSNNIASLLEASTVLANLDPVLKLEKAYLELAKEGDSVRCIFYGYSTINLTDNETGELIEKEDIRCDLYIVSLVNDCITLSFITLEVS